MSKIFDYKIDTGNSSQPTIFHINIFGKIVINLTIRLLNGTVVFKYIKILDQGLHHIDFNHNEHKENVFLVFFEVNNKTTMQKIEIQ